MSCPSVRGVRRVPSWTRPGGPSFVRRTTVDGSGHPKCQGTHSPVQCSGDDHLTDDRYRCSRDGLTLTARRNDDDDDVGNTDSVGREERKQVTLFFPPAFHPSIRPSASVCQRARGAATSYPIIRVRHLLNLATRSGGRTLQTLNSPFTVFHPLACCAAITTTCLAIHSIRELHAA